MHLTINEAEWRWDESERTLAKARQHHHVSNRIRLSSPNQFNFGRLCLEVKVVGRASLGQSLRRGRWVVSKSKGPGHSNSSTFHARIRLAPGERSSRLEVNRTAADEDEGRNLPTERELSAHSDALAEVLHQLAVGCRGQIKRSQNTLRVRWRRSTLRVGRSRSVLRASCRRQK